MPTYKARKLNGAFLKECRRQKALELCGLMDAFMGKPGFADDHFPEVAERFTRFIKTAEPYLNGTHKVWPKSTAQKWIRQADGAVRRFSRKHNLDD